MRSLLAGLAALFVSSCPAAAIIGGAAAPEFSGSVVMISSDRGSFCSAVVLSPQLLLTAGHCVRKGANYRLLTFDGSGAPSLSALGSIAMHPKFDAAAYEKRRFVIDLALVSLPSPIAGARPVALPDTAEEGVMGARYLISGYGLSARDDGRTGGTLRRATLTGVPLQSDIQLRLADPDKRQLGACQGDSGGPVFRVSDAQGNPTPPVLVGILGSARGEGGRGCGGFTGVALIGTVLPWIRGTAAKLGQ